MEETARRREKQQQFNIKHGIVARGVAKKITDMIDGVYAAEPAARFEANSSVLDEKTLAKRIKDTEKAMLEAARDLRFEQAAELRDQLRQLKAQLFQGD